MCVLLLLLVAGAIFFLLARQGKITGPHRVADHSPEADARKTLADRFARGDISADEFMERASVLNWTPGSDAYEGGGKKKKR